MQTVDKQLVQNHQHIHLVGIGGAGLSAIATVLLEQGFHVSGSDVQASDTTQRLRELGALVNIGHQPEYITQPDLVVISSAVPEDNPEVIEARRRHIPVQKRPTWLGEMMKGKRGITIAGTHGKTTTTAMVAFILTQSGLSPTYIIGGYSPQLEGNAAAGQSDLFVIEADEYDHTFLSLTPEIAIITTLEWDHPDIYPTPNTYYQAFVDFSSLIPKHGHLILCGDDTGVRALKETFSTALTYGLSPDQDWQAINPTLNEKGGYHFTVAKQGKRLTQHPIDLSLPGQHNAQNALAAFAVSVTLGVSPSDAALSLSAFQGTGRRFELKGNIDGITIVDDYAHHPSEIKTTLSAARMHFGNRPIWAVFQPHTYSRTKSLLSEFAIAFQEADHAILLDIFSSARESNDNSISSLDLLARMQHQDAHYLGPITEAVAYLQAHLAPGDVLLTLGAGDGYKVGEAILAQGLRTAERTKLSEI